MGVCDGGGVVDGDSGANGEFSGDQGGDGESGEEFEIGVAGSLRQEATSYVSSGGFWKYHF